MCYKLIFFVLAERSSSSSTDSTFQEHSNTQTDSLIYNVEYGIRNSYNTSRRAVSDLQ